jgi:dihydropyrimidinase
MEQLGPYLKCNPPLRSSGDTRALWQAVRNRIIDCVGTDHCPYQRKEKEPGWNDIRKAAPGLSGLAEKTALMFTKGVLEDRITMNDFVELCCKNPAKIFGLYPQKGTIQIGSDADLVILDTKNRMKVSLEKLHTRSEFSPYEGWELRGWPTHTIVRGTVVYREGEIVGRPGFGRYMPRRPN